MSRIEIKRADITRGSVKSVRAVAIVILVGIGVTLIGVPADAQLARAVSTPTVPNPNWCPGAPASPPPQILEPDVWNREWQRCMNLPGVAEDYNCGHLCRGALEMQWRARNAAPTAELSPVWPAATDKQQGPFRLKNGAWMFIGPRLPAPKNSAPESTVSPQSNLAPEVRCSFAHDGLLSGRMYLPTPLM